MTISLSIADQWLYEVLSSDSTLTGALGDSEALFNSDVPDDQLVWPVVLFGVYSPEDMMGIGGVRIKSTLDYVVRVVGRDVPFTALNIAASRIDFLLHGARGTTSSGGTILSCVRIRPFSLVEISADPSVRYRHLGGIYRLEVQET